MSTLLLGFTRAGFVLLLKKVHLVEDIFLELFKWAHGEETEHVPTVVSFKYKAARRAGAKDSLPSASVSASGGAHG